MTYPQQILRKGMNLGDKANARDSRSDSVSHMLLRHYASMRPRYSQC